MATRNQAGKNQTKDLKCATHLLSEKFRNMSEEKKTIVRNLGFGGLMHIPPLRVHHQVLRELTNNFKLGENRLKTGYGSFKIRPKTLGDALGINASDEMMDIGVGNEQDRLMFKRIFILYIQMAFLLPTTINKISPVHLAPIFEMDTITERNWGGHVLSFIIKGITDYKEKKKKAIDGCLFVLMIIYFHLSKNKDKKRAERPPKLWIANWSKEQLVERMRAEIEKNMGIVKMAETREKMKKIEKKEKKQEIKKTKKWKASSTSSSETETTDSDSSTSKSETQEDSEDSPRKEPSKKGKKEKEADLRSTESHYVSSETIPDVNLRSDDPSSQGHTEQSSVNRPAESMLSLVEESASEPADSNMMVVRKETPSEGLAM
ncbi:uncharacterized protein DS421_19g645470 [Arachis hypogaea]|uniref:Aminotransferase-like plant mobile domain-containing protein n=1 Tax=Arachis hypogaea TaxID=3818 RepID=A0A6B9V884_ARAHY|nr:uncharacterized protein DS421_19g645470 [Arachis hypogaea]